MFYSFSSYELRTKYQSDMEKINKIVKKFEEIAETRKLHDIVNSAIIKEISYVL